MMQHVNEISHRGPNAFPALLLNADYTPWSVHPLKTLNWRDSISAVMSDRVRVVDSHGVYVRTAGGEKFELPAVVALSKFQNQERKVSFTRIGVYMRDRFSCGYCQGRFPMRELTFDHVVPSSKGGKTTWTNIVTACMNCNLQKGDKSPKEAKMHLHIKPYVPTRAKLNDIARSFPPSLSSLHRVWLPWLGIDVDVNASTATESLHVNNTNPVFPDGMTDEAYWNAELES